MNRLKELRIKSGLSRNELSILSGVSERMIRYYETDYKPLNKASVDTVLRIAKTLNCGVEDIVKI